MPVLAQYDRSKNLRPKRNIRTAMNNEIMLYGIAQKEQMGFDVRDATSNPYRFLSTRIC